jgi:GTP cyclohydrolase II
MELLKKYRLVIIVVLPILILVLIRSSGLNYFKNDAKKRAEPSLKQSNIMIIEQAGSLSGKNLIINLDKEGKLTGDVQNIPADSVLTKNYVTMIMKHDGPVLLFSSDPGLSARIWMILSQLGCRNIYILTNSSDNEVFKYKFRPDTLLN